MPMPMNTTSTQDFQCRERLFNGMPLEYFILVSWDEIVRSSAALKQHVGWHGNNPESWPKRAITRAWFHWLPNGHVRTGVPTSTFFHPGSLAARAVRNNTNGMVVHPTTNTRETRLGLTVLYVDNAIG